MVSDSREYIEQGDFIDSRSNTRIIRRRMVLDVFENDPRLTEEAVFWFGDEAFVATEYNVRYGQQEYNCTKLFIQGRKYHVTQSLETINDFLFGEY